MGDQFRFVAKILHRFSKMCKYFLLLITILAVQLSPSSFVFNIKFYDGKDFDGNRFLKN